MASRATANELVSTRNTQMGERTAFNVATKTVLMEWVCMFQARPKRKEEHATRLVTSTGIRLQKGYSGELQNWLRRRTSETMYRSRRQAMWSGSASQVLHYYSLLGSLQVGDWRKVGLAWYRNAVMTHLLHLIWCSSMACVTHRIQITAFHTAGAMAMEWSSVLKCPLRQASHKHLQ
jgi:hypothetical protein